MCNFINVNKLINKKYKKMAIQLNDNLKINVGNPIDSRYLNSCNYPYVSVAAVNAGIPQSQRYSGLTVNILNTEYWYQTGTNDGNLVIKNVGSTGGTTVCANNGLTKNGNIVSLGGTLTGNTTISLPLNSQRSFTVGNGNTAHFYGGYFSVKIDCVFACNNGIFLGARNSSGSGTESVIQLIPSGITICGVNNNNFSGINYYCDYSVNYTNRSLVDKGYVLSVISGSTGGTNICSTDKQIIFNSSNILCGSNNFTYNCTGDSLAVNQYSGALGCNSVAMAGGYTYSGYSVAMAGSQTFGFYSVAMASGAACGYNSVAMAQGTACGGGSVAMAGGTAYADCSVAMAFAAACGYNSVAMAGGTTCSGGTNSVAIADGTTCGCNSVAMANGVTCGDYSIAMAQGTTYGCNSVAMGGGQAGGDNSVAMGGSVAGGNYSVAMGNGAASGIGSVGMAGGNACGCYSVAMAGGCAIIDCSISMGNLFCGNTTGNTVTINNILKLAPTTTPANPTLGTIFTCTDNHLYFYNGSAWKQLDNL